MAKSGWPWASVRNVLSVEPVLMISYSEAPSRRSPTHPCNNFKVFPAPTPPRDSYLDPLLLNLEDCHPSLNQHIHTLPLFYNKIIQIVFYLVSFFINLLWTTTRFPLLSSKAVVPNGPLQAN